jgi:integrase/recombinase XerD
MDGTIKWFPLDRLDELETAILDRLDDRRRSRRRDALACALGLSGLRSGEVAQLTLGDLSVGLQRLRVRTLKGGPERTLELDESLIRELMDWRQGQQLAFEFARASLDDLLLPNCRGCGVRRDQFNAMAKRIFDGLFRLRPGEQHGLTFHSLRHTFGMRAYQDTLDLFLVQRMLGHASIQTTEIYARSLKALPDSCKVRLGRNRLAERMRVIPMDADGSKVG